MRGGNSMKNPIIAGLIAGFASGIVATIFRISGFNEELFSIHPYYSSVYGALYGVSFSPHFTHFSITIFQVKGLRKVSIMA